MGKDEIPIPTQKEEIDARLLAANAEFVHPRGDVLDPADLNAPNPELIKHLLKDNTPQGIKETFWALTDKENALTNMTSDEIKDSILDLQDLQIAHVMTKGEFDYSFEDREQLSELGWAFIRKLRRSKDGFERNSIVKHIQERRIESGGAGMVQKRTGFLGRIFGRR